MDNSNDDSLDEDSKDTFTNQHGVPATPPPNSQQIGQDLDTATDTNDGAQNELPESREKTSEPGEDLDNEPHDLPGTAGQGLV